MPIATASGSTTGQMAIHESIAPVRIASRVLASGQFAERWPKSAAHSATSGARFREFPAESCVCCSPSGVQGPLSGTPEDSCCDLHRRALAGAGIVVGVTGTADTRPELEHTVHCDAPTQAPCRTGLSPRGPESQPPATDAPAARSKSVLVI
jgi:hypothetical protein